MTKLAHEIIDIENEILGITDRIDELRWEWQVGMLKDGKRFEAEMAKAKDKLRHLRRELGECKKEMSQ